MNLHAPHLPHPHASAALRELLVVVGAALLLLGVTALIWWASTYGGPMFEALS